MPAFKKNCNNTYFQARSEVFIDVTISLHQWDSSSGLVTCFYFNLVFRFNQVMIDIYILVFLTLVVEGGGGNAVAFPHEILNRTRDYVLGVLFDCDFRGWIWTIFIYSKKGRDDVDSLPKHGLSVNRVLIRGFNGGQGQLINFFFASYIWIVNLFLLAL